MDSKGFSKNINGLSPRKMKVFINRSCQKSTHPVNQAMHPAAASMSRTDACVSTLFLKTFRAALRTEIVR